jgi:hypothetical protein
VLRTLDGRDWLNPLVLQVEVDTLGETGKFDFAFIEVEK